MADLYLPHLDSFIRLKSKNGFITKENEADEPLPHLVLQNNKFCKLFSGYRLIEKDLKNIMESIMCLKNFYGNETHVLRRSLMFFIIITYGKCFTKSEGRGVKLDLKGAIKDFTESEELQHLEILNLRHKYVAHGGISNAESNPVVIVFHENKGFSAHDNLIYINNFDSKSHILETLVNKLLIYTDAKINDAFERMMGSVSENLELYKADAFTPNTSGLMSLEEISSWRSSVI